MVVLSTTNDSEAEQVSSIKSEESFSSEKSGSSEKFASSSGTREFLKRAKEAANQKFAQTINKPSAAADDGRINKTVLCGKESPAFHTKIVRIKLENRTLIANQSQSKSSPKLLKSSNKNSEISPKYGHSRSLFEFFCKVRREYEDFGEIEALRLQKRLEKLSDYYPDNNITFDEYEKKIVPWQSDSSAKECYLCETSFTLVNRRHHCRLCGRIICGSEHCMNTVPVKLHDASVKELKSCLKCYSFLFKKRKIPFHLTSAEEQMISLYKKIKSLKNLLLETIPRFNEYLMEETITEARPLKAWRQDAWTLRDTLILYSVHFRSTIQELCELLEREALDNPIYKLISMNIRRAGNDFLQKHMFTLQIVVDSGNEPDKQKSVTSNEEYRLEDRAEDAQTNGFKSKLKKIVPSLLTEMFRVTENSDSGYFEFYTDEGDLIPLTDDQSLSSAVKHQLEVLTEQLNQLKLEREKEDADKNSLNAAIEEVQSEIERLNNLKNPRQINE